MEFKLEKQALRRLLKEQRAALPFDQTTLWDAAIARNVINSRWFAQADTVFVYISVSREVDTASILDAAWQQGKQVAVPRCAEPGKMDFFVINSREDLVAGAFGIPEPKASCPKANATSASLCIVPALAFDCKGFRIGYGGGYYDRFLAAFPGKSMGLVRSVFLLEQLPVNRYDLPVDVIVLEEKIILTR